MVYDFCLKVTTKGGQVYKSIDVPSIGSNTKFTFEITCEPFVVPSITAYQYALPKTKDAGFIFP